MLSSAFALKNISGRPILEQNNKRTGSFPVGTDDFLFVKLTRDELDDAQMVWWLLTAYFPLLDIAPRGTRAELVLAMRLLVCHLRECNCMPPSIDPAWGYYRRRCTDVAHQRMCCIIENSTSGHAHHPDSHEWGDAPAIQYRYVLAHFTPLMDKLSDNASNTARRRQEDYDLLEVCRVWGLDKDNKTSKISNDDDGINQNSVRPRRRRRGSRKKSSDTTDNNNNNQLDNNKYTDTAAKTEEPRRMLGTFRTGSRRWWGASWPLSSSKQTWFVKRAAS